MKILVTGGAGFIGSHVVKQLIEKKHEVVVYDNLSRGFKSLVHSKAKLIIGSLSEEKKLAKSLENVDAVIHMAAFLVVPESVKKPDLYWENNVVGSRVLLSAMRIAGVEKIVFSSSATVYGDPDQLPLTEESPIKKAANPYGQTKIEMEKMIRRECEKRNFNAIILRYFNPYGPNEMHSPETHAVPNFVLAALDKKPVPLYWKGEQVRDFIYVEDLASAHIDTLNLDGLNIFNVGTGRGTKVIDLVNKIFEITGYRVKIEDLGTRPGDVEANYTSPNRIERKVGWKQKFSLDEGLEKTIEFFKKQRAS